MSQHLDDEDIDCRRFDDLLESFIDEDLDALNRRRCERHLSVCSVCSEQLGAARRLRQGLRSLPKMSCPDHVVEAALRRIEAGEISTSASSSGPPDERSFLARLAKREKRRRWQPLLALAATLLLVIALPRLFSPPESDPKPLTAEHAQIAIDLEGYSAEDIARAEEEVKIALAYLGRITEASSRTVGQEVLGEKVILPLSRSVRQVLDGGAENAS